MKKEIIKIIENKQKEVMQGSIISDYYEGYWAGLDFIKRKIEGMIKEKKKENKKEEELTDKICPVCGEKLFKHFHTVHGRFEPYYHWFWCRNFCELDCNNCKHSFRDECTVWFCLHYSSYNPIKYEGEKK